jgi:hypothetical protein
MGKRAGTFLLVGAGAILLFAFIPVLSAGTPTHQATHSSDTGLGAAESPDTFSVSTSARISDGSVEAETTFDLRASDGDLNYWTIRFTLPEGARVVSVEDTFGKIEDYEVDGDKLKFETNPGEARESETVRIDYVVEDAIVAKYGNLKIVEVGFVGYNEAIDRSTSTRITADDKILSASHPAGFSSTVTKRGVVYEGDDGEGSATARVAVGDGKEYDRYALFGDQNVDLSEADSLYSIVPRAFGFEASVYKHPVVVLSDEEYNETVNKWSEGQYRSGGVILLRSSADDVTETMLHETVHAYNSEALSWSDPTVGWFEEGTSEYVEFLADRIRGETRLSLFVGNRTRDGERVGPRRTIEELRRYYDGTEFMRSWEPSDTDNNRKRFGYTFSELIVRSYVNENGATALHETYDNLREVNRRATTPQEATGAVLNAMDTEAGVLRPCMAESRSETIDCLRRINTMEATVPAYDGIEAETYTYGGSVATEDEENRGALSSLIIICLLILIVAMVFVFFREETP